MSLFGSAEREAFTEPMTCTVAELADRLLNEAGVAVLGGSAFGEFGSTGMRVSFANSRDNLRAALAKVKDLVESG